MKGEQSKNEDNTVSPRHRYGTDHQRSSRTGGRIKTGEPPDAVESLQSGQFTAVPCSAIRQDKNADYRPALVAAIADKRAEIERIANNPAPPDFANTYQALEQSGQKLQRVSNVFSAMTASNTSDELQALDEEMSPILAALDDDMMLNGKLFARLDAVYQQRQQLKLDAESLRLVEVTASVRAGRRATQ